MTRQAGFLLAAALLGLPAAAQDAEFGGLLFESFCSSCHGEDGKGQGQLAAFLAIHPPDLTQLAAGNGGVFPVSRVVRQIDGRDPELAHGGVMPLFGEYFDLSDTADRLRDRPADPDGRADRRHGGLAAKRPGVMPGSGGAWPLPTPT